jgi:hypothetical protein
MTLRILVAFIISECDGVTKWQACQWDVTRIKCFRFGRNKHKDHCAVPSSNQIAFLDLKPWFMMGEVQEKTMKDGDCDISGLLG